MQEMGIYRPLLSNSDCTTGVLLNQLSVRSHNNGTFGRSSVNMATLCIFNISSNDGSVGVLFCIFSKKESFHTSYMLKNINYLKLFFCHVEKRVSTKNVSPVTIIPVKCVCIAPQSSSQDLFFPKSHVSLLFLWYIRMHMTQSQKINI